MDTITIYDLEFWTDEGAMNRKWNGLTDEIPHVMQIGAVKLALEEGLPELGRFNILVKPRNFQKDLLPVTPFFTELTNITEQDILKNGLELKDALDAFYTFAGEKKAQIYSYGGDERSSFLPSCFEQGVAFPFKRKQVWNIVKVFQRLGLPFSTLQEYNSGALAVGIGLSMPEEHQEHDAFCDVLSLVTVLRHLTKNKSLEEMRSAL